MPKDPTQPLDFDSTLEHFFEHRRKLDRHSVQARNSVRFAKRQAWHTARAYQSLLAADADRLRAFAESEVGDGPELLHRFIEQSFAGLAAIGEDPYELLAAVNDGMTQAQYVGGTASIFLSRKKRGEAQDPNGGAPLPAKPDEELPLDLQLDRWKQRALAAECWKPRALDAERRLARIEKQMKLMQKQLNKVAI